MNVKSNLLIGCMSMVFLSWTVLPLYAQMPVMFPWWDNPIAQDLGLSEQQHEQIRKVVREWRVRIMTLNDGVQDAEAELGRQMNADQVDEVKAGEAIDKVVEARGQLMRTVSQMSLKLRLVLTPDQWQELQKRQPRPPRDAGFGKEGRGPRGTLRRPPRPPDGFEFP